MQQCTSSVSMQAIILQHFAIVNQRSCPVHCPVCCCRRGMQTSTKMQSQGFLTLTIYSLCTFSPELVCNFHDGWKYVTSNKCVYSADWCEAVTVCGQDKKYDAGVATLYTLLATLARQSCGVSQVFQLCCYLRPAASTERGETLDCACITETETLATHTSPRHSLDPEMSTV